MMGKQSGKKKQAGPKPVDSNANQSKKGESSARKAYDKDTAVFISVSQELKEEGNKLFQKRDHEGAMLNYEKALNLLPSNHVDVPYLHSNIAACYMQRGLAEYPKAIHECNLALELTPKYTKALLKRARCYEALNRLDLALRDGNKVLKIDQKNLMATEIVERVKTRIGKKGNTGSDEAVDLIPVPEYFEPPLDFPSTKLLKEKPQRKKKKKKIEKNAEDEDEKGVGFSTEEKKYKEQIEEKKFKGGHEEKKDGILTEEMNREEKIEEKKVEEENEEKKAEISTEEKKCEEQIEEKANDKNVEKKAEILTEEKKCDEQIEEKKSEDKVEEKRAEDKLVVEEKIRNIMEEESIRAVKLVFGEDIRWAKIPVNCSILELREIIHDRFPSSKAVLIKYRDQEGDLITITTNEELRWAESSAKQQRSIRLYVVEVNPEQDPFYEKVKRVDEEEEEMETRSLDMVQIFITENGKFQETENGPSCFDDWIIQFAQLFMNNVGFNLDGYLDIHELGMKLYSEAMEETVTSEEAQDLFETAANKFQEMAALALFNWGNVHMSRARKRVYFKEDDSKESVLEQVKIAYEWAQKEYSKAGQRYEEALKIKPDFYEGVVALGTQQFEQAKLSWYFAIATNVDLENWLSAEVIQLYNSAEENMEKGMQMWELIEEERLNEISRPNKVKEFLEKMDLGGLINDLSADEAAEQTANMRSMINVLWGTMLYERSIMEYKLGLPVWQECLEVAVEKFELAGASPTDIAVMIKNHCSNCTALEGIAAFLFYSFGLF